MKATTYSQRVEIAVENENNNGGKAANPFAIGRLMRTSSQQTEGIEQQQSVIHEQQRKGVQQQLLMNSGSIVPQQQPKEGEPKIVADELHAISSMESTTCTRTSSRAAVKEWPTMM